MSELIAQPAIEPRADAERARLVATSPCRVSTGSGFADVGAGGPRRSVLYLVNLTVSGLRQHLLRREYAQAASQSWSAWFFGALDAPLHHPRQAAPRHDAHGSVGPDARAEPVVDPLPQAHAAIGSYSCCTSRCAVVRAVRGADRRRGHGLTPVAVLIFRYDNPDALLTFLAFTRAWASGAASSTVACAGRSWPRRSWARPSYQVPAGLPRAACLRCVVWLVSAPVCFGAARRLARRRPHRGHCQRLVGRHRELLPASAALHRRQHRQFGARPAAGLRRPWPDLRRQPGWRRILGSLRRPRLAFNNPVGRGGPRSAATPASSGCSSDQFGGQVAWLLPAALLPWRWPDRLSARRTDPRVAATSSGALAHVHVGVFSFMSGSSIPTTPRGPCPGDGALVGGGASGSGVAPSPSRVAGSPVLGLSVLVTGITGWLLLERTPDFRAGSRDPVLALSVRAAAIVSRSRPSSRRRSSPGAPSAALVAASRAGGVLAL